MSLFEPDKHFPFQLLNCVSNLVTRDPAVEVRRGAVSLITLLLRGLDTEALQVSHSSISQYEFH